MDEHPSFNGDHADTQERNRLEQLFAVADEAINAGIAVMPAAVWLQPDGGVGKAPLLAHGHLDAHHDRQLIRQQLANPPHTPPGIPQQYETAVAILPGTGGYGVLDCDVKHGKTGRESYDALVAEHGPFATAAWRSPSGGGNVLFRKPPGAAYGNVSPWPGIDIRADGGWVVAPGNSCTGGTWTWMAGTGYHTATPLPAGLAGQLKTPSLAGHKATNAETVAFIEASPPLAEQTLPAMHAFKTEIERLRQAGVGSRHDALVRAVSWAFGMETLDLRWAVEQIQTEWARLTAGEGREAEVNEIACWVAGREVSKREAQTEREMLDVHQSEVGESLGLLTLIDWTEIHDPTEDAVDQLVIYSRWLQFVAGPKVGKSSLEIWVAIELSEGRDPFDGSPVTPLTVLYCDGEMGRLDLEEVIRACGHDPTKLTNLRCSSERVRLDTDAGATRLLRRVDHEGARIVILDGLNGFLAPDADENDAKTWRPLVAHTIDPLKQRGIAVISGDNMGKDPGKGSRGSSVKTDKADAVVVIKRTNEGVKLKTSHGRGGAYIDELDLNAEGFDRAQPIRYWRAYGSWPDGTSEAVKLLDLLKVPLDHGRDKIRKQLAAEIAAAAAAGVDADRFRVRNDVLSSAIRYRRITPIRPGTGAGTGIAAPSGTGGGDRTPNNPSDQGGQVPGQVGTDTSG